MKRLKLALAAITVSALAFFAVLAPAQAFAFNPLKQGCSGAGSNSGVCTQANNQGTANPVSGSNGLISKAVNIVALAAGAAAVIMILVSAFMFVTAGGATPGQRSGDPNAVKKARSTLMGAIIGLIVVALAWTIARFITDKLIQ